MTDLEQAIDDLEQLEQFALRKASTLANLLDEQMSQKEKYVALRTEMGKTANFSSPIHVPSWTSTHTLEWVGRNLKMGSQMPFMESYIDDHGRIRVDERNAEELKQRAPDWTRQPELAAYLIHDKQRKFGTILAVVCPPWVDDPTSPNWGADDRAVENAIRSIALDTQGRVCLIDLSDTLIYALDGQHRVMGILGVVAVRDNGFLEIKRRDGTSTNKTFTRQDLLERFRVEIGELQALLTESISVEYIPAVLAGETREEANRRIRDVFVCINSYAKKTKAGETILLDESDGFSIVARRIGTSHSLFRSDTDERVNWPNNTITKAAKYYSTLDALKTIAERYLPEIRGEIFDQWKPLFKDQVPLRPTDEELTEAYDELTKLWDLAKGMPIFQNLLRGDSVVDAREFPDDKSPDRLGHLMLRPIGQQIFARAVAKVMVERTMSWDQLAGRLEILDQAGELSLAHESNLWYRVLYDPRKKRIIASEGNRDLASDLLVYLLMKGADGETRKELLAKVIEHRKDERGERWIDFDGRWSSLGAEETDLPIPP